jgi:hypothetical protein
MNAKQQRMEVVVPVSNEEASVEANIELLLAYPLSEFPFRFAITIADNASSDPPPAATRPGRRMVLRHRALAARGAERHAHPRGARRLGRRPRLARGSADECGTADGRGTSGAITAWVESTFKATTVAGTTVCDLSSPS